MRLLLSVVLGTTILGFITTPPALAQSRYRLTTAGYTSGGSMGGGNCNCMPMRSRYLYGYANPGYSPGYSYGGTPYGGIPYGGMPYPAPAYGVGAGSGGGGSCGSGSCGANSDPIQTSMQSFASLPGSATDSASAGPAAGVPVDGTLMTWPVGLRVLAPTDVGGLRQQVHDLFEALAAQKASGTTLNARLAAEANHALDRLQRLVNADKEKAGLPQAVNQEAERFIARLRKALNKLQEA